MCSVFGSNFPKELRFGAFIFIAFLDFSPFVDLEAFWLLLLVFFSSDSALLFDLKAFWLLLLVFFGSDSSSFDASLIGSLGVRVTI